MEMDPTMAISLDTLRLAISYRDGIVSILTASIELMENALAAHLSAIETVRLAS